jgi:hypothetical protein
MNDADDRADDRADAAEQARAADDDRRDRVEVVRRVPADRRRPEARERQVAGQAGQRAAERVHLDQVQVDVDAGAPRALEVGAARVRVAAEPRLREHDAADQRRRRRDQHQVRDLVEQAGR